MVWPQSLTRPVYFASVSFSYGFLNVLSVLTALISFLVNDNVILFKLAAQNDSITNFNTNRFGD